MLKQMTGLCLSLLPPMIFSASCYDANYDTSKGVEHNAAFISCVVNQTNACNHRSDACVTVSQYIQLNAGIGIESMCQLGAATCGKQVPDCTKDLNYWKNQLNWSCNPSFSTSVKLSHNMVS